MLSSRNAWLSGLGFLLLLFVPNAVIAGWPSNMEKRDVEKMQDILSGRLEVPGDMEYFVKYKNKRGRRIAKKFARNNVFTKHLKRLRLVTLYPKNRSALKKMLANPHIEYVEPLHQIHALPVLVKKVEDANTHIRHLGESLGYGIKMIQADKLWALPPPKEKITICVIDSGYGLGHPDLPKLKHNVTGTSTSIGKWREDEYGHGTHCAGVIGAIGNNDIGVAGVMNKPKQFNFHIGKALDSIGNGSELDMLDAFEGCMNAGAKVITMSFGLEGYSQTIQDICKDAYDKDVLLVAAAGNNGGTSYTYPASFAEVISVAAVGKDMKVAGFSQYNDQVEIAAPGVDIVSTVTLNNGEQLTYNVWSGTSMATPHVAGVAASVWSHFPECTNNQIRNVLIRSARDDVEVGCTEDLGFGIVQAREAYDLLTREGCIAGDLSREPLTDGAVGGCSQDPLYTPPPSSAPTPFSCDKKLFVLELQTDAWSDETSWDLKNSSDNVIASGGGYRKNKLYYERLCLPPDAYTFTIRDSDGDGICCNHGDGHYSIMYDEELVKQGGNFGASDNGTFGEAGREAATVDDSQSCRDDPSWTFTTAKGNERRCVQLGSNPSKRCKLTGVDESGTLTNGYESCPHTCGSCGKSEDLVFPRYSKKKAPNKQISSSPTASPAPNNAGQPHSVTKPPPIPKPTLSTSLPNSEQPLPTPTRSPTAKPTTKRPTLTPTSDPTFHPTKSPTQPPSFQPTRYPTASPTVTPTVAPTSRPSKQPSQPPTPRPSSEPTSFPTTPPTTPPTTSPISKPSKRPSRPPKPPKRRSHKRFSKREYDDDYYDDDYYDDDGYGNWFRDGYDDGYYDGYNDGFFWG